MAALGRLTRSGMLYEGNWVEWEDRMFNHMEMTKAGSGKEFRVPANDPLGLERMGLRDPMANSICKQVSPAILDRVPPKDRGHLERLLHNLKALARPFRLNDLPPELRARIFQFHFGQAARYNICAGSIKDKTKQPLSNLLLVSRATKTESLPLFLGSAEICSRDPLLSYHRRGNSVVEVAIRSWIRTSIKEKAKYLRCMTVKTYWGDIVVRLNMNTGLELGPMPPLFSGERIAWTDHVKKIELIRQALGLRGEAVVLVLTTMARS
ncbi:hypothetical protein LTR49_010421 [Elasticomyces elasticus]|nr:hypothetical protein LTR49_010421 [Elasticomyces elasticus]